MKFTKNVMIKKLEENLIEYKFLFNKNIEERNYDAVILNKKNQPIALILKKERLGGINKIALGLRNNISIKHKVLFVINKSKYRLYDISKNSRKESPLYSGDNVNTVIDFFNNILISRSTNQIKDIIYANLKNLLLNFYTPREIKIEKEQYSEFKKNEFNTSYSLDKIKRSITIDTENKKVTTSFKNKEDYGTLFLDVLIDDLEEKRGEIRLYRYGSFEAIFSTIKNFTYRLNGIQGMNDQKEGMFLFENLFRENQEFNERLNDVFISSCSTKYDNLTMWRLYGNNSNGAAITIELTEDYKTKPFYIKKLYYKNTEKIKSKIQFLNAQIIELGYELDSRIFSLFPFFIKSHHYDVEAEVRILYDKSLNDDNEVKCEWGISEPYKIIRPYVDIKIFSERGRIYNPILPFKIIQIILGPNCPFSNRNIKQIKHFLSIHGWEDVEVIPSKIDKDTYIG